MNDDDKYLFLFSNISIFLPSTHPNFLWKRSIWDKCRRSYFSHDQFQLVTEIFWNYITNFDTHTIQTNGGRSQFSQNHVLDTCHKSYLSYDNFLGRNFSWWFDEDEDDDENVEKYLPAPSTMFLLTDLTGVFPISIISLVSLLNLGRLVQGLDCFLNWCFENRDVFFG